MAGGAEAGVGGVYYCFAVDFDFGDIVWLLGASGHGEDQPICPVDTGCGAAFFNFFHAVSSEPVAQDEFCADIPFIVRASGLFVLVCQRGLEGGFRQVKLKTENDVFKRFLVICVYT